MKDATYLANGLKTKQFSSEELFTETKRKIEKLNPEINAFVTLESLDFQSNVKPPRLESDSLLAGIPFPLKMLGQEKKAGWQLLVHGFLNNTERLKIRIMSKQLKKLVWFHLDKRMHLNLALRILPIHNYMAQHETHGTWHTLQEDQVAELQRQLRQGSFLWQVPVTGVVRSVFQPHFLA